MLNAAYRAAAAGRWAVVEQSEKLDQILIRSTTPEMITTLANFAGVYGLDDKKALVAAPGYVGSKLKVAFALNRHDTVGVDCVASAVNDIICHGAKPLFFLEYVGTNKVYVDRLSVILDGIGRGCNQANVALLGGKTAELPGFYRTDEYDLFGFVVGVADRSKLIDGSHIREGDVLIGLSSNGVHLAGFDLIRKLFSLDAVALNIPIDSLGSNLGDELLKSSRIYSTTIQSMARRFPIHGIAHINEGGLTANVPRMLPDGLQAHIQLGSWTVPPVYEIIRAANKTPMIDLFDTFNMGLGMVIAVPSDCADAAVRCARELDEEATIIGEIVQNDEEGVVYFE